MKPSHPISSSTSVKLLLEAVPKDISGSTSYLPVWLAFHPYPQLIQILFNGNWFGPPQPVTAPSTWSRVDHKVSRLFPLTSRPFKTRFRFGSVPEVLNLASEKQLVGSLCKRHAVIPYGTPTACKRTVSGSISPPCSGYFSPFLHSTGSLSVFYWYLALRDGPRWFRQDSSCPALLRILLSIYNLTCTGLSPSLIQFPNWFHFFYISSVAVLQPQCCLNNSGLGYSPFARHYSENRYFFLFLQVLRCFSSLRWLM